MPFIGLAGHLRGVARFNDSTDTVACWSSDIYSGSFPPEGYCSLSSSNIGAVALFLEPRSEAQSFAALLPGKYAQVYEKNGRRLVFGGCGRRRLQYARGSRSRHRVGLAGSKYCFVRPF